MFRRKAAARIGRASVIASSVLLVGVYVCYQAGVIQLPFLRAAPSRIMAGSKSARILAPPATAKSGEENRPQSPTIITSWPSGDPTSMVVLPRGRDVMMFGSKSGAVVIPDQVTQVSQQVSPQAFSTITLRDAAPSTQPSPLAKSTVAPIPNSPNK